MAREKVERGSGARESRRASMGEGERRLRGSGKGDTSSASGRLWPEGGTRGGDEEMGWERDAGNRREGESDEGRDVSGRTEVI